MAHRDGRPSDRFHLAPAPLFLQHLRAFNLILRATPVEGTVAQLCCDRQSLGKVSDSSPPVPADAVFSSSVAGDTREVSDSSPPYPRSYLSPKVVGSF